MVLVVAIVVVCGDGGWLFGIIPIIEPQYNILYDYNLLLFLLLFHIIYQIRKNNKLYQVNSGFS